MSYHLATFRIDDLDSGNYQNNRLRRMFFTHWLDVVSELNCMQLVSFLYFIVEIKILSYTRGVTYKQIYFEFSLMFNFRWFMRIILSHCVYSSQKLPFLRQRRVQNMSTMQETARLFEAMILYWTQK